MCGFLSNFRNFNYIFHLYLRNREREKFGIKKFRIFLNRINSTDTVYSRSALGKRVKIGGNSAEKEAEHSLRVLNVIISRKPALCGQSFLRYTVLLVLL